jgi:hypothetical protein
VAKAKAEKQALLDEEEKQFKSKEVAKKPQGKKAQKYDAAEAQRKALIKQLAKMGVSTAPEGGAGAAAEDDGQQVEEGAEGMLEIVGGDDASDEQQFGAGSLGGAGSSEINKHPEKR